MAIGGNAKRVHMILRLACVLALAAASLAAARADAVDQGQELAGQAIKAAEAGNFATAADLFRQALALRPNHPAVTLRLARASARAGRIEDAVRALEDYAAMGLTTDADHRDFKPIAEHPRMTALRARFADNAKSVGAPVVFATLNEPRLLAEGIAHDAATGRTYIGDVHGRRILVLDASGKTSTFGREGSKRLLGAFGLALANGTLWVASSALPQVANLKAAEKGLTGLFAFYVDGRIRGYTVLPADGKERTLGDVAVAKNGDVYTSDSTGGTIHVFANAGELEPFVESEEFHSPQGIALAANETRIAIADYSNGIHIVERATKAHIVLPMPPRTTLHGIDALVRHGRDLIAVQNGIDPQRVIIIRMNANWTAIEGLEVLAANLPDMSEPTLATHIGDDLLVIGNGQWSRFNDDGTIKGEEPFAPTTILRLKLPEPRS